MQDNGYWNDLGWSFDCGWQAPDHCMMPKCMPISTRAMSIRSMANRDVVMLWGRRP